MNKPTRLLQHKLQHSPSFPELLRLHESSPAITKPYPSANKTLTTSLTQQPRYNKAYTSNTKRHLPLRMPTIRSTQFASFQHGLENKLCGKLQGAGGPWTNHSANMKTNPGMYCAVLRLYYSPPQKIAETPPKSISRDGEVEVDV